MAKRITVNVSQVKRMANAALSSSISQQEKKGVCAMVEAILHYTENYKGFRYLEGWPTDNEYSRQYN